MNTRRVGSALAGAALLCASALSAGLDVPAAADGPAAQGTQDFVTRAAQAGMAEVKLSQLAKSKGENPAVRGFAENMIADHQKAGDELRSIADAKKLKVPGDIDAAHQAALKSLVGKSGADFDTAYMMLMRQDHDKAVSLFRSAADSATLDPELKAFAARTLPTLETHDEMAHKLAMGPNGMMMKKTPFSGPAN